jgi:NTE family protein
VADPTVPAELAVPVDFDARYGAGIDRGVSLGGGGLYFVAWLVGYLHGMARAGLDLGDADRMVGTSAGSLVATSLTGGHLARLYAEVSLLSKAPKLVAALAPAGDLAPSQQRALDRFLGAGDAEPGTVRAIGHAALAAATPSPASMTRRLAVVVAERRWPSDALAVTCVDAYSGERCVVTRAAGVPVARAVAASSAVPGIFPPQPVGDRRCMDGGVSGTGTHPDLLAGAGRAVVLSLTDGHDMVQGTMTVAPGGTADGIARLEASGTRVFLRTPDGVDPGELMAPSAVPRALTMGARQAVEDRVELGRFWGN